MINVELTAANLIVNGSNIVGLPTVSTAINDNSAAASWGVLLETLNAMDANLVHQAGDTMTGQLNAKTVVVDGKLSDGSTAGWSSSVNNGYLRMNNNYIATLGTTFANDHTQKN
jgi:hypothetical protein